MSSIIGEVRQDGSVWLYEGILIEPGAKVCLAGSAAAPQPVQEPVCQTCNGRGLYNPSGSHDPQDDMNCPMCEVHAAELQAERESDQGAWLSKNSALVAENERLREALKQRDEQIAGLHQCVGDEDPLREQVRVLSDSMTHIADRLDGNGYIGSVARAAIYAIKEQA